MPIILEPYFWDEPAAHAKLERIVWPNGPVCLHCGATDRIGAVTGKGARAGLKFCGHCRKQFRATIGTMFEGSHVPLHKWFQACFLLTATMRGISAHQLHLRLEVTNKTALWMVQRLDAAMHEAGNGMSAIGPAGQGEGWARPRVRWRQRARRGVIRAVAAPAAEAAIDQEALPWVKPPSGPPRQFLAFVETARELGYSSDPDKFDQVLQQLARHPPLFTRHEAGRSRAHDARDPAREQRPDERRDASARRFG